MRKGATISLALIAVILVSIIGALTYLSVTGFFVASNEETKLKLLNLDLNENLNYTFDVGVDNLLYLKSLQLSGVLTGDGTVNVYLVDGDNKFLIADRDAIESSGNKKENNSTQSETTVSENGTEKEKPEKVKDSEITFDNVCVETCNLTEEFNQTSYTIEFEISGVILKAERLRYTVVRRIPGGPPVNITPTPETEVPNITAPKNATPNITGMTPEQPNATAPAGKSLLFNPSFEDSRPENANIPRDWFYARFVSYWVQDDDLVPWDSAKYRLDSQSYDGGKSILLDAIKNSCCRDEDAAGTINSRRIKIDSRKNYILEFYFKTEVPNPCNYSQRNNICVWDDVYYFEVRFNDASNANIGDVYFGFRQDTNNLESRNSDAEILEFSDAGNGWKKVKIRIGSLPESVDNLRVEMGETLTPQSVKVWIDNIRFVPE